MTMLSNLIFIFLIPWETHSFFFFLNKYWICICAVEVILDSNLHKLVTSRFGVEYYVYACLTDSKGQMKSLSSTGNSKMDWLWNSGDETLLVGAEVLCSAKAASFWKPTYIWNRYLVKSFSSKNFMNSESSSILFLNFEEVILKKDLGN